MKESFENRMVDHFRKILDSYQVDYDPNAWQRVRKDLTSKSLFKRLRWKYPLWGIVGIFVIAMIIFWVNKSMIGQEIIHQNRKGLIIPEKEISQQSSSGGKNSCFMNESVPDKEINSKDKIKEKTNRTNRETSVTEKNKLNNRDTLSLTPIVSKAFDESHSSIEVNNLLYIPTTQLQTTLHKKKEGKFRLPKIDLNINKEGYKHFIGPNKLSVYYNPEFHHEKSLRNPGFCNGIGIEFEGPLNSSFDVAFGLEYHFQAYSSTKTTALDTARLMELDINPDADSISSLSGNYGFIEIPLTLRMKLLSNRRSYLSLDGGFSMQVFLKQAYYNHIEIETIEADNDIEMGAWKNIHPLGSVNLGLTYRHLLSDRISIEGSIVYKYHLSEVGALPMELNRFSAKAGITYRFGRKDD